jgi:transposase-like protein
MRPLSFKRHRFAADVIRHAVWLYFRFTLSLRDVEELLAQRGIEVSYETIRCWTIKFGPQIARNLKRRRPAPSPRWHLGSGLIDQSQKITVAASTMADMKVCAHRS